MKPRIQGRVLEKLELETRRDLRRLEDACSTHLLGLWATAKADIQDAVAREYRLGFGRQPWTLPEAEHKGTLARIASTARERLARFEHEAKDYMRSAFERIYREEAARALWMLDVLTPPSHYPRPPRRSPREADAPRDYRAGWDDALGAWIASYQDTLRANLRLEALNEGDAADAVDEVDATQVGGQDPARKISTLFANQAIQAQAQAQADVLDANEDDVAEEIWMTMEDARVCDVCDEYDGKPIEEVPDEIPAHFNCHCYTRIVPRAWAEMLRSGSPAEKEAALRMDDAGLVPDAMAILNDRGDLVGHFTIEFSDWVDGRGADIYGQNIAGFAGAGQVR